MYIRPIIIPPTLLHTENLWFYKIFDQILKSQNAANFEMSLTNTISFVKYVMIQWKA